MFQKIIFYFNIVIILAFFTIVSVYAWNSPTAGPPNSAGQALYINTSGNVGIGGTSVAALNILRPADATNTNIPSLRLQHNTRRTYDLGVYYDGTFRIRDIDSGNYAMTIDSNQNVGIGTTAPAWKLDVVGGSMRADGYTGGGQLCIGSDCRACWPSSNTLTNCAWENFNLGPGVTICSQGKILAGIEDSDANGLINRIYCCAL